MKVYFSHGKESGPWGSKITRLSELAKAQGCEVESIDYTDEMNPDARVERLLTVLQDGPNDYMLVGSSMGGYVSLVVAQTVVESHQATSVHAPKGVFVLAPALYLAGYAHQSYSASVPVEVVHGWSDDIVPVENTIRFAQQAGCTAHLIVGDHRLNSSLPEVERYFVTFLQRVQAS